MNIEEQVPTIELSKKLKELGYPQEGLFWWYENNIVYLSSFAGRGKIADFVAPTVAEMGEWLPTYGKQRQQYKAYRTYWNNEENYGFEVTLDKADGGSHGVYFCDTEADARAGMLIWLIESEYLEFKE